MPDGLLRKAMKKTESAGMSLNNLTATEVARRIADGETTAEAVVSACLDRVGKREPQIKAFECFDAERAIEAAWRVDREGPKGLLAGVPFAAKDIIDTKDFPTALGSKVYAGNQPERNAACVERFLDAGAILLGKSVTTEFATFTPSKTRNPVDTNRTPGGSSSGSAAAVADRMIPLAFGTQTAASIIRPAAYCGTFAYKASIGAVDMRGVMELSRSLDSFGVFSRSAADLSLSRQVLRGNESERSFELPRISLMREPHWNDCDINSRNACESAVARLTESGEKITETTPSPIFRKLAQAQSTIMAYEVAQSRKHEYANFRHLVSAKFADLVETGLSISDTDYASALQLRDAAEREFESFFESADVLLVPASTGEAPRFEDGTGDPLCSRIWTLLGAPAIAIPFGFGSSGLPVAIQLVARRRCDDILLDAAIWFESKFLLEDSNGLKA